MYCTLSQTGGDVLLIYIHFTWWQWWWVNICASTQELQSVKVTFWVRVCLSHLTQPFCLKRGWEVIGSSASFNNVNGMFIIHEYQRWLSSLQKVPHFALFLCCSNRWREEARAIALTRGREDFNLIYQARLPGTSTITRPRLSHWCSTCQMLKGY